MGDKAAKESGYFATSDFFKVFDLPAIYGDPKTALATTGQVVITQNIAEKYFPNGLALNKTLQLDNDKFYTVGAVIQNLPANVNLPFDWLINFKDIEQPWMKAWGNNNYKAFVRIRPGTTSDQAESVMIGIYPRYANKGNEGNWPILQPI